MTDTDKYTLSNFTLIGRIKKARFNGNNETDKELTGESATVLMNPNTHSISITDVDSGWKICLMSKDDSDDQKTTLEGFGCRRLGKYDSDVAYEFEAFYNSDEKDWFIHSPDLNFFVCVVEFPPYGR